MVNALLSLHSVSHACNFRFDNKDRHRSSVNIAVIGHYLLILLNIQVKKKENIDIKIWKILINLKTLRYIISLINFYDFLIIKFCYFSDQDSNTNASWPPGLKKRIKRVNPLIKLLFIATKKAGKGCRLFGQTGSSNNAYQVINFFDNSIFSNLA